MMNVRSTSQSKQFPQEWHMPIIPNSYPDRRPQITNEEKRLMEQYVSAAGKTMTGGRAKRIFDQLARFEQPYVDTVRLIAHTRNLSIGRRHLFTFMIQTGLAFWAWPKEIWIEVIQTTPQKVQPQGVRLWMTLLAYFFGGFLYVGASTSYGFIADIIFGKTRMDVEVGKLYAPLRSIGYDKEFGGYHRFRWTTAFALLINRHPAPEALSASTLVMVYELVAQVASIGRIRGRRALMHLQLALCELDILYVVQGQQHSKTQFSWLPQEVFKLPGDVRAALQPNPRDIGEDAWFKLIWAACTLSKEHLRAARMSIYPLAYYRAASLIWVTAARRSDEIRRLQVGCVRREWAPEMRDEQGNQIEPEAELAYIRIPTNKFRGEFFIPVPSYVADAIEVWESVRPPNQKTLIDRKTRKPTNYLFQYRNELMGRNFLNESVIPLLCKLAGVSQTDVVGRITSHRARATTATWMHKMGMAPADIGKLLGHTDPLRSLPWYLREDKHRLGRAYRKANPLERYVAAILDTNAHARQEPCVFYYLSDGPDGRPRMCGNPHFSRCIHQLQCIECEAFIDHEQAEAIEKREGAILISVPIPLPSQIVAELNEQDEAGSDATTKREALPPPTLPGPAFHFNKKVPLRSAETEAEDLHARLQKLEAQIAKKPGKVDQRSASMQALLRERAEVQARLEAQEKDR
jgi:integrase